MTTRTITPVEQLALLRAYVTVERLKDELAAQEHLQDQRPVDETLRRTYLLQRAALADRGDGFLDDVEPAEVTAQDAEDTARRFLDHDRARATGQGPVPAAAARWDADPRGYVRQEHAVAVRQEHEDQARA
ncbi:hypothetical protein [Streptomyces sp. RLA2-12]|uniref:hypothetical protein n=1 Tax=Streptomyces sp. RLA2-12 TaxID=2721242 RepID=UPI001B7D169A|nr:hypothetical protein [Streptomyces sp. RLA2-12]